MTRVYNKNLEVIFVFGWFLYGFFFPFPLYSFRTQFTGGGGRRLVGREKCISPVADDKGFLRR